MTWLAGLRRYGADLGVVAAGRVLTALGGVVGVRILTEALPPAAFGRYKLALAALSLASTVLVRPFLQYAMRAYHAAAAAGAAGAFLGSSRRWLVRYVGALSVAAVAGGYLLAIRGQRLSLPELAGVVAILALQALVEHDRSLAVTRGRQRSAEAISVAMQWSIPLAVAALARLDRSLWTILLAHAAALALIAGFRRLREPRAATPGEAPAGGQSTARENEPAGVRPKTRADAPAGVLSTSGAWPFAWPLMVAGCLGWLLHESDRFILGHYHGDSQVGLYAAAYGLVSAPFVIFAGAAVQIMYPAAMAAGVRREGATTATPAGVRREGTTTATPAGVRREGATTATPAGVRREGTTTATAAKIRRDGASPLPAPMLAATLAVGVAGVAAVWLWGDLLAALLLAESYRDGVSDLLVWIALGYACLGISYCFDLAAHGVAKTRYLMISSAVAAATNVGLNFLLVPAGGAEAAAIATAAALVLYLACMALCWVRGSDPHAAAGGQK